MTRENVETKGRRYLTEGRLTITQVSPSVGYIAATCRGSAADYSLGFDPGRREWRCTCEARGRCAHLVALQLVTKRPQ